MVYRWRDILTSAVNLIQFTNKYSPIKQPWNQFGGSKSDILIKYFFVIHWVTNGKGHRIVQEKVIGNVLWFGFGIKLQFRVSVRVSVRVSIRIRINVSVMVRVRIRDTSLSFWPFFHTVLPVTFYPWLFTQVVLRGFNLAFFHIIEGENPIPVLCC